MPFIRWGTSMATITRIRGGGPRSKIEYRSWRASPASFGILYARDKWRIENALRFATKAEAERYVSVTALARAVVESVDAVNARWNAESDCLVIFDDALKEEAIAKEKWRDKVHGANVAAGRGTRGDRGNRIVLERGWPTPRLVFPTPRTSTLVAQPFIPSMARLNARLAAPR